MVGGGGILEAMFPVARIPHFTTNGEDDIFLKIPVNKFCISHKFEVKKALYSHKIEKTEFQSSAYIAGFAVL